MPFQVWTRVGTGNNVLDGVQIPTCEGATLRLWGGSDHSRTCLDMSGDRYTQSNSAGDRISVVWM